MSKVNIPNIKDKQIWEFLEMHGQKFWDLSDPKNQKNRELWREFDMVVFVNAIKIPSRDVAKEIFESPDGKNFLITEDILTHLCLNNMVSILKQAITSRIKVHPDIASRRRRFKIMF